MCPRRTSNADERRGVPAAERGREVRDRLLAAAAGLVPQRGWSGVSTRAVAAAAGVAPGLVHYHFASVQALLREAAVGAMREVAAATMPALEAAPSAPAGVDALLGALDAYDGSDPTSLLFAEAFLAATRDDELRADLAEVIGDLRDRLATWLAGHGVTAPEETAAVLAAAVDGLLLHRALRPDPDGRAAASVLRRLVPSGRDDDEETP
jgi:AcrR family transcriptional regulator